MTNVPRGIILAVLAGVLACGIGCDKKAGGGSTTEVIDAALKPLREKTVPFTERQKAAETIAAQGADAVPQVISLLKDTEWQVRQTAVYALGEINDKQAVQPVIDVLLKDENENVRLVAADALGRLSDTLAVPALIEAMQTQQDHAVMSTAARSLGRLGDAAAVEPLVATLDKEPTHVALEAMSSLAKIGDPRGIAPLAYWTTSGDRSRRTQAAGVLGQFRHEEAFQVLVGLLETRNNELREIAVSSLAYMGEPRAIPLLRKRLADEKHAGVRSAILKAIERIQIHGQPLPEPSSQPAPLPVATQPITVQPVIALPEPPLPAEPIDQPATAPADEPAAPAEQPAE